jgi:K+-sensing histidine kinase KdpD
MDRIRQHRAAIVNLGAVVLPLAVAAVLVPFRSSFTDTAAALVLVAVIVAAAVVGSRPAGFLATVSATVWFDFFLTRPYEQLAITHRADIQTAGSLFVVGMIVTELAARNRQHQESAIEESDYVGLIYRLSELVASGAPADEVIERVRRELINVLDLRGCRYEPEIGQGHRIRMDHDGTVVIGEVSWAVNSLGLPGPELALLVRRRGQTLGRFVLEPTPGLPVTLQRRVVAVAIADQVGAALTPQLRSA